MIEIGMAGGALILLAWLFETYESVKNHKSLIDLRFTFIYIAGIALISLYSFQIGDPVFLALNLAIFSIVTFEIAYTLLLKNRKRNVRGS